MVSGNVTFDESSMLPDKPSTNVPIMKPHDTSVQVEHVIDSGSTKEIEVENVQEAPNVVQPPQRSIAADKTKRNIVRPTRLIKECNIVAYALRVAEERRN